MNELWNMQVGEYFRFTENPADAIYEVHAHNRTGDNKRMVRVQNLEDLSFSQESGHTIVYPLIPESFDRTDLLDIDEEDEL